LNKLLRMLTVTLLSFGWLIMAPTEANPNDPISIAAQEIQDLKNSVDNLGYKDQFNSLIDIAEDKYDSAVDAKQDRDDAYAAHVSAVSAETTALEEKTLAQSAVDEQTVTVATALTNKNNAQDALDIANINLSNTPVPSVGYQGVAFEIYPLSRNGNYAYIAPGSGLWCQGGIPTFDAYAGWEAICGANQNFIGIFRATLTVPANINSVYGAHIQELLIQPQIKL